MPHVTRWLVDWGRSGDAGVIAWHGGERLGAAWCRVLADVLARDAEGRPLPELAIAVAPGHQARGVGARCSMVSPGPRPMSVIRPSA